LYDHVRGVASGGVAILLVEQLAYGVLGLADAAAIMLHGRVERVGPPGEIADELSAAYLGGKISA
jgi:branched-chain amino acid transport system ATP-binding protein